MADRETRRFEREFDRLADLVPGLRTPIKTLRAGGWWIIRIPLAFLFILGGVLSFLPVLGLWMLPFGLLLLAVDIPILRPPVTALLIWGRRRARVWLRWLRMKRH